MTDPSYFDALAEEHGVVRAWLLRGPDRDAVDVLVRAFVEDDDRLRLHIDRSPTDAQQLVIARDDLRKLLEDPQTE